MNLLSILHLLETPEKYLEGECSEKIYRTSRINFLASSNDGKAESKEDR